MKTWYLQDGVPANPEGRRESRAFIDDYLHPECEAIQTVDADTFQDAARRLKRWMDGEDEWDVAV